MRSEFTMKFAILLAVLVAVIPVALIWSLNTLFAIGIGYTIKTWFAALIITCMFGASLAA
jgi:hypothetical protein